MTLLNVISFLVMAALAVGLFLCHRHLKREIEAADGAIDINTHGDDGTDPDGIYVGSAGDSSGDELVASVGPSISEDAASNSEDADSESPSA